MPALVVLLACTVGMLISGGAVTLALYSHLIAALPPNPEVAFAGLNM